MSDFRKLANETSSKILMVSVLVFGAMFWLSDLSITGPLSEKAAAAERQRELESQKKDLLFMLAGFETSLSKKAARLVERPDRAWLIEALNAIAREAGMSLSAVTPQDLEAKGRYLRLPVLVEARCTWHELGRFSSRLESASKLMKIERLSAVQNRDSSDEDFTIDAKLLVSVFVPAQA